MYIHIKMEFIDLNKVLNRTKIEEQITHFLHHFQEHKHELTIKRGIYVYGNPGTGKTTFVMNLLNKLNYDIVKYDAGDIRNTCIMDTITKHNMSDKNVLSMLHKKTKQIAIVMDEIDGMNNGDKGGINSLIKMIRPKKTKKQKKEEHTMNPIICIGNYHLDKKINELIKVCDIYELKTPTMGEINNIINTLIPSMEESVKDNIVNYIQCDLRKLISIYHIYSQQGFVLKNKIIQHIFQSKTYNDDSKKITKNLLAEKYNINDHMSIMNETDRTTVGLLLHENIVDNLQHEDTEQTIPFYNRFLDNMCFSDYIDRVTFQKQIWQFNEMSSLVKTFYNNKIFHERSNSIDIDTDNDNKSSTNLSIQPDVIRFTKVLTKYSTEYNNSVFIQKICFQLAMDENDMKTYFYHIRNTMTYDEIVILLDNYDISKLDINRMYRYLDKNCINISNDDDNDNDNDDEGM